MAYLALKVKNSQIVKYLETPDYCHNVIKLSICVPLTVYLGWSILHKAIINSLHISLWPLSVKTEKKENKSSSGVGFQNCKQHPEKQMLSGVAF